MIKKIMQWAGAIVLVSVMLSVATIGIKICWDFTFKGKAPALIDPPAVSASATVTMTATNEVRTVKTVEILESGFTTVLLKKAKIDWTYANPCDLRSWRLPLAKNEEGRVGLVRGMNKGEQPFYIQVPDGDRANWRLHMVDEADAQKLGIYGESVIKYPGTVWVLEFIEEAVDPPAPVTPKAIEPAVEPPAVITPAAGVAK